jgi:hypothetical protein
MSSSARTSSSRLAKTLDGQGRYGPTFVKAVVLLVLVSTVRADSLLLYHSLIILPSRPSSLMVPSVLVLGPCLLISPTHPLTSIPTSTLIALEQFSGLSQASLTRYLSSPPLLSWEHRCSLAAVHATTLHLSSLKAVLARPKLFLLTHYPLLSFPFPLLVGAQHLLSTFALFTAVLLLFPKSLTHNLFSRSGFVYAEHDGVAEQRVQ